MATGITRNKETSENEITIPLSVQNSHKHPAPKGKDRVTLSYINKASEEEFLTEPKYGYAIFKENKFTPLNKIVENSFILDDNLNALLALKERNIKVDLFYLDPPYGTGYDFQSRDMEFAYSDGMGMATYLEFMRQRLIVMHKLLDKNGSIYIHIGHQMLGHLKALMDEIFGIENCRNIITRKKCSSKNFTRNQYANVNDFILFYSKSKEYTWNQPGTNPNEDWINKEYTKTDDLGRRYKLVPIHAPGNRNGATGEPWRNILPPPGKHWQYTPKKLEELDKNGDIYWSKNGNPRRKVYWTSDKKIALTDYWEQFRDAHHQSIKITGYPTEKNFSMLKMIVGASSNPGQLVVDPFCGSGTTIHAARDMGRNYIGIDASFKAAQTSINRLKKGLEKMGDYVTKKPVKKYKGITNEFGTETQFIVNDVLLNEHEAKLIKIMNC